MNQKELIRSQEWDCLIILDACRYDFFERIYLLLPRRRLPNRGLGG